MAICSIELLILGETCHLKGRDMVTVWRTVLLLSGYYCDSTHQHFDVTQFEYVLWRHTMHEWVMNIHYKTWIAQGRFTNMILTPSKQWGVCHKYFFLPYPEYMGYSYHNTKYLSWGYIDKTMVNGYIINRSDNEISIPFFHNGAICNNISSVIESVKWHVCDLFDNYHSPGQSGCHGNRRDTSQGQLGQFH